MKQALRFLTFVAIISSTNTAFAAPTSLEEAKRLPTSSANTQVSATSVWKMNTYGEKSYRIVAYEAVIGNARAKIIDDSSKQEVYVVTEQAGVSHRFYVIRHKDGSWFGYEWFEIRNREGHFDFSFSGVRRNLFGMYPKRYDVFGNTFLNSAKRDLPKRIVDRIAGYFETEK
ncbi:MAG TPA: hypothetical protein VN420_00360 [Candidatus Fimivivens sp.]|nr:hypothetical protein [Candidatus Fimivivens sp.]